MMTDISPKVSTPFAPTEHSPSGGIGDGDTLTRAARAQGLSPVWEHAFRADQWDGSTPTMALSYRGRVWIVSSWYATRLARLLANAQGKTLIPSNGIALLRELTARAFPATVRRSRRPEGKGGKGFVAWLSGPVTVLAQAGLAPVLCGLNLQLRRYGRFVIPESWADLDLRHVRVGGVQ